MLRFILTILLMAACFFAGKMSAMDDPREFIVENVEKAFEKTEVFVAEILALTRNENLEMQYPDLYRKLMAFLATPQIKAQLENPNRSNSPLYQKLVELVTLIQSKLNS